MSRERIRIRGHDYVVVATLCDAARAAGARSVACVARRDDGRRVVLKRAVDADDEEDRALLAGEHEMLASLHHPGIVAVVDFGRDEASGVDYLATEYVDGEPLWRGIRAFGERDAARGLQALLHVCGYLADRRLAHCDIKPGNILVRRDLSLCLIDFGVATPHGELVRGMSPTFTAPEHLFGGADSSPDPWDMGDVAGPATDLYALGVTWYWLLTGRHPHFGQVPPIVLHPAAYERPAARPTSLNPTLDPRWNALLLDLIDRDPLRRLDAARRALRGPAPDLPAGQPPDRPLRACTASRKSRRIGLPSSWCS